MRNGSYPVSVSQNVTMTSARDASASEMLWPLLRRILPLPASKQSSDKGLDHHRLIVHALSLSLISNSSLVKIMPHLWSIVTGPLGSIVWASFTLKWEKGSQCGSGNNDYTLLPSQCYQNTHICCNIDFHSLYWIVFLKFVSHICYMKFCSCYLQHLYFFLKFFSICHTICSLFFCYQIW